MVPKVVLSLFGPATIASATQLFVASYSGTVNVLSLTENNASFSLSSIAVNNDCAPTPSWLTLDANRGLLFCLNEGATEPAVNGSISSYTVSANGTLTHVLNTTTLAGPVSGIIYGDPSGARGLAVAHYGGSAVSSYKLNGGGDFALNNDFVYTLDQPGPVADRQAAPHAHEAILDPTGQYIVVPDLGADLLRVYAYDENLALVETKATQTKAGNGPRHAVFYTPYGVACEGCTTFLYVVNELAASVTGYSVEYLADGAGIEFTEIFDSPTFGTLQAEPEGTAPSEILISPDNRYLIVANRNDSSIPVSNPDPNNSTQIQSDTISTFALSPSGTPSFSQIVPVQGSFPRHVSINRAGNMVAVALQKGNEVVILGRDPATGLIGGPIARIAIDQAMAVVFNDWVGAGQAP